MTKMPLIAIGLALLAGCDRTGSAAPDASATEGVQAVATPSPAATVAATPVSTETPATGLRGWQSADGKIALRYPAALTPTQDFSGTYFTPEGWRAMFDGMPVGPGKGLVRFTAKSVSAGDVPRIATDMLQIGVSKDAAVLADCLTRGLQSGNGSKLPDRTIGGVRFTAWSNGDAGMSHQLSSIDLRAVHDGQCIAIDRLTSSVPAAVDGDDRPARTSAELTKDFEAVLASMTFD